MPDIAAAGLTAGSSGAPPRSRRLAGVLVIWFVVVLWVAATGGFVAAEGTPPVALLASVGLPVLGFVLAVGLSTSMRQWVATLDLHVVAAVHAWRFVGFGFLALYAYGILPGLFAWPAGLGDIAVATTAPFVAGALVRRPSFAGSRTFRVWNWFGLADLAVALAAGVIASGLVPGLAGSVTTAPMGVLPLALVPAFLVPLMVMLHVMMLMRSRIGVGMNFRN